MVTLKIQTGSFVCDKNVMEKTLEKLGMEYPVFEESGYILLKVKKEDAEPIKNYLKINHGIGVSLED